MTEHQTMNTIIHAAFRRDLARFDAANAQRDFAEICFNARGHTYYRTAGAFNLLVGVPRFQIENSIAKGGTGLSRTVIVPPNGAARFTQ